MDITFSRHYLNADYEVIIEDDAITTSKIYMDGELVASHEYSLEDGSDVPLNRKNLDFVYDEIRAEIKERIDKDIEIIAAR